MGDHCTLLATFCRFKFFLIKSCRFKNNVSEIQNDKNEGASTLLMTEFCDPDLLPRLCAPIHSTSK